MQVAVLSAMAALGALVAGPPASAQLVVGQTAPAPPAALCEYSEAYDELQYTVAAGNSYVVPASGVLTSWSTNANAALGQLLGLKIYRPLGGTLYSVVAQDGPKLLTPGILNVYPISIPVLAGDVLGITMPADGNSSCDFPTGLAQDVVRYAKGNVPSGGSANLESSFEESRLNVSATLLPPPTITAITPAKGSIKGAGVTIAGANFASVSAVSFGSVPAQSFTVDSEGQITAVAPASKILSKVPVTVTTVAGSAASAQLYAYEGCKVPKLKGKKLKAAKKKAKKANCKIGKVKKLGEATAKAGKVTKQNPKPGKILVAGTKIKVTLAE